jgi:hypothetical protein
MSQYPHEVSLGFAPQTFPAGVHICQIFSDDEERLDSLLAFLCSGLAAGERTACFTEKLDDSVLAEHLAAQGLSLGEAREKGHLTHAGARDVYFQDNRFDPDRMLDMLKQLHEDSVAGGYPAARVIGEMNSDVEHIDGGSRLMEYESRVSLLLREYPVTAVCQYNASTFDGATIMRVLKVHPLMVIRGAVVHNPYYVPPEEYLAQLQD